MFCSCSTLHPGCLPTDPTAITALPKTHPASLSVPYSGKASEPLGSNQVCSPSVLPQPLFFSCTTCLPPEGQGSAEWVCCSKGWRPGGPRAEWTHLIARKENQFLGEQSQGHSWENDAQTQPWYDLGAWELGLKGLG